MKQYIVQQLEAELTALLNDQFVMDDVPINEIPDFQDNTTMFMARAAIAVLAAMAESQDSVRPHGIQD